MITFKCIIFNNDRTDEVNMLFIKMPFRYGPEPAINENQQLVSG